MWQSVVINLLPSAVALAEKYLLKRDKMKPEVNEMFAEQLELNKKMATEISVLGQEIARLKRLNKVLFLSVLACLIALLYLLFLNKT